MLALNVSILTQNYGNGAWIQQMGAPSVGWQSIAISTSGQYLAAVVYGGAVYTNQVRCYPDLIAHFRGSALVHYLFQRARQLIVQLGCAVCTVRMMRLWCDISSVI
jgi:hypothetical protein